MGRLKTVYLAGLINPQAPRTIEWRTEAAFTLQDFFIVLNPLRGKDLRNDDKFYSSRGQLATRIESKPIVARDYRDILRSDYLLANLDDYGSDRPMVGTLFELAWAWQLCKPVIAFGEYRRPEFRNEVEGITAPLTPTLLEHPFVEQAVTEFHYSLEDATDSLLGYYV